MKLLFQKGKQKELVLSAKKNLTWRELGDKVGVSMHYFSQDIKNEKTLLDEKLYRKLCDISGVIYDKYILKKFSNNWGQVKGGTISSGKTKKIKLPEESEKLAELYGILLGDGCVTKIKSYKVGTYEIRIVGDSRHDKEYLINYVKGMIETLFDVKVKLVGYKGKNALGLVAHGKKLVEFFESKGFKPGNKITNQLRIPYWIRSKSNFLKVCIRGLYDTDGGIYKLNNQNVYQICFTNYNSRLLNDVRDSLLFLGMNPSKIYNKNIRITKKSELRKFLKLVGFSNPRHLNKVKMWNLAL